MTSPTSRRTAAAAAALLALGLTACSVSTQPDEVALEYSAGPFSSTEFDSCIDPGNRDYHGPGDRTFTYPAGQRTLTFSGADDAEMGTATVVSSDDLELKVTGLVTFSLVTDCDVLRQFHEQLGLKYGADETSGWNTLLADYIGAPLNRALDDATKSFTWRELYTSGEKKAEWEGLVAELLYEYIAEQGGGNFFGRPTGPAEDDPEDWGVPQLTLQQPTPPEEVRAALTAAQEAIEQTTAQEAETERVEAELEAIEQLVEVLGPDGYLVYEALKNGEIEVLPLPYGSDVNVTPGRD
ncbi:SPFH domain-containing protein [Nocardiopsis synnemataformans]|uniref:SPFH domain-containing protein n=1 Tax=Nocardiopsis synnemataformans TaxID=61305 RepID=UPI003EBEB1BB